ncbi:failed axon connections homolog isoform X2 [Dreissena polymorpha]|uniref:failed axon connections homolog isoform X2 n=1 Tax=Dreissena polymorpha TaxID=45954 RepID=UPI002264F3DB|nr:failed axon connections homolog isoform X2 [Dreissena polymorpha]
MDLFSMFGVVGILGVLVRVYFYWKNSPVYLRPAPKDVVVLYQVGRGPKAPSFSPFPMKLETFLRMMKIPYMNDHTGRFSAKQKTPWMALNGVVVADSQLCIEYLKKKFDLDPDSHITAQDKAIGRAFLKLTEENLYWTMCIETFGRNFEAVKKVIPYSPLKKFFTLTYLKFIIALEVWGHGIGRHTEEEVWDIAVRDMEALSTFLGLKRFLLGDRPSEVDCAVFGMLSQIYWHMDGSRHQLYMQDNLQNLVDYIHRMKDELWPDWDAVVIGGSRYSNDDGKLYFPEKVTDKSVSQ